MINSKSLLFISASALLHFIVVASLYLYTVISPQSEQGRSSLSVIIDKEKLEAINSSVITKTLTEKKSKDHEQQLNTTKNLEPVIRSVDVTNKMSSEPSKSQSNPESFLTKDNTKNKLHLDQKAPSTNKIHNQAAIDTIIRKEFSKYFYYPKSAQRKNWQGLVILRFIIEKDGLIKHISISQSSGYSVLDNAAVKALEKVHKKDELSLALNGLQYSQLLPVQYRLILE